MTLWSPDTCDCRIEFSDDGNLTYIATHNACAKHVQVANTAQHFTDVLAHNRKKNSIVSWLLNNVPSLTRTQLDGTKVVTVSVGYDPAAPVQNDPVLVKATDVGVPTLQNTATQTALDAAFGTGGVKVI